MEAKSLYVIDDDEIFQFMVRKTLKAIDQEIQVKVCPNGAKAIAELKEDRKSQNIPDIILLDINMPIMDGWEFLKRYNQFKSKISKDISIYIVSSSADPEDIHKAQEIIDVSGYITKPIARSELKIILMELPQNYWMTSSA